MDLNPEVEYHIGRNVPWTKLPPKMKESFGNSHKGYEKAVIAYSIRNQLRFSDHIVKTIRKDESKYYEEVVTYSKDHLMLYPYHLSDRIVKGLRITPFQYYISILEKIMEQEKSYDALPNFTAADCLRLLGIGRNQYIELMNQHRSSRKLFRKRPARELLPTKPADILIEPWFIVQVGYLTEDDVSSAKPNERKLLDFVIDNGGQIAGSLDYDCVHSLYRKGLVYLDVPVENDSLIIVPPLEGFVMNRVLGDYFETLLYKIFVSIDEHTTVDELATVLDIDTQLIKNAVSLYCRLGFAYKKNLEIDISRMDQSWAKYQNSLSSKSRGSQYVSPDESLIADELSSALSESDSVSDLLAQSVSCRSPESTNTSTSDQFNLSTSQSMTAISGVSKRIAFLYDSTLTAFLMMGNLSPGLKNHAVTMFEVGKMSDESLDSFLTELEQVSFNEGEGEAQRYFEHAKTLRKTILFLRNNPQMGSMTLDLLRCESLLNLDNLTLTRLLNKNYSMLVSMSPLSYEVRPVSSEKLPHLGPAIPHVNSIWFKLFLYSVTDCGPTSLLLSRGTMLNELPAELEDCHKYLVTSWGHDPGVIPGVNAIFTLNDALCHSAILVQAYGVVGESATVVVPFPFLSSSSKDDSDDSSSIYSKWAKHPAIVKLSRIIDLERSCGYVTMMNTRGCSTLHSSNSNTNLSMVPPSAKLPNLAEEDLDDSRGTDEDEDQIIFVSDNSRAPSEPRNGFRDDKCAKLYKDELSSAIDEVSETDNIPTQLYDSRQQKIESLRLDLSLNSSGSVGESSNFLSVDSSSVGNQNSTAWYDDWTILDCHFGLPLFDSTVNQIVSDRIVSNNLWEESSLEQLVKSNQELGRQLTEFIYTCQEPSAWNEEIALPSKNFYCHNGRLQDFELCN